MSSRFIAGIDVGTSHLKAVIAENQGGKPVPRLVFKIPSAGIEKGTIVDIAEASQSFVKTFHELRRISKEIPRNLYLGLGTHHLKSQFSRGFITLSRADNEIYQDDIDRAVRSSGVVNFPPNWSVVHQIPREFVVDEMGGIENPLGLAGSKLEVHTIVIGAFSRIVKDLLRAVEVNGGRVGGVVCGALATSRSVLSKKQRRLGTAIVDMGAGTTSVAAYEDNKLLGAAVIPLGAQHITNDIAVGIKVPLQVAEKVKIAYGYAMGREIDAKEKVDLERCGLEEGGSPSRRYVADIIQARLAEILDLVDNELKIITKAAQLPGGVVLVGGGAKLPGITQLARQRLGLSGQIGCALQDDWGGERQHVEEYFEDPEFATAFGLALWGSDTEKWSSSSDGWFNPRSAVRFMKNFLP